MRSCTRKIDLVARQGGDEFIFILPDIYVRKDIETLCQRIASEISRPFIVNGNEVYISVSMGIALAPQDAMNASDLIRLSDIALYKAKNTGRNNWVFYEPNMGEYLIQRREMEKEFREALCTDQFQLVYQPRYDIKTSAYRCCRSTGSLAASASRFTDAGSVHPACGRDGPDRCHE
ncbi:Bacteriophytochrome cph2 [Kluyvera cryocrescens]|uniref:Bacteriophytochrome cph2 n=1 Tax=Kluyvera cryocrescens TaxID=580 RepID=A0A485C3N4_KLUCR|nr:Bacteriophytochrome cph2 [Kluyvera cryocrescens]